MYDNECGYHFVVKHIQRRFMDNHEDFEVAASYLEQEATMMQRLHHGHISTLRGTADGGIEAYYKAGGTCCDAYFLIVDRISELMEQRIKRWSKKHARRKLSQRLGGWLSVGIRDGLRRSSTISMTRAEETFYCERLEVAYQIADALEYMHQQRIAYRNFGIDKVGFNFRNEVQLIELGDAETLAVENQTPSPLFSSNRLRKRTDCVTSYTAPEAFDGHVLTSKADSYSFSKLFSEILTLVIVGPKSTSRETHAYVSELQRVAKQLPKDTLDLLERGANMDPRKRPTLREFCVTIDLAKTLVGQLQHPKRSTSLPTLRNGKASRAISMSGTVH